MWTIFTLELKAVFREYKKSFNLTVHNAVLVFLLLMFSILSFYLLNTINVNKFLILNILLVLIILAGFSFKKDYLSEFVLEEKSSFLNLYPFNSQIFLLIKGIKYEIISFLEITLLLISVLFSMLLAGYSSEHLFNYYLLYTMSFFAAKNFQAIISKFFESPSKSMDLVFTLLKSLSLVFLLLIISYISNKVSNFLLVDGDVLNYEFNYNSNLSSYLFNYINSSVFNINIIPVLFIIVVLLYILKVRLDSKKLNLKNSIFSKDPLTTTYLEKLTLKFSMNNIAFLKEFRLLVESNIIEKMLKRVYQYFIAGGILLLLQATISFDFKLEESLLFILVVSEITVLSSDFSKTSLGFEKRYIIYYVISNSPLKVILNTKAITLSLVLSTTATLIYTILAITLKTPLINYIGFLVAIISYAFVFSYASTFFYTYKTSYVNTFKIPNKLSAVFIVILASLIGYIDITIIFLYKVLVGDYPVLQFLTIFLFHLAILLLFKILIKIKRNDFYGEYKNVAS